MNYQETLHYLFNQLPMYQRIGKSAYKADLSTSLALDKYFKHPHKSYYCIHIAGTNGKGSVSHMLASILQEAGYRCGLYTSPHLKDFRERIKINGDMIPEEDVVQFIEENKSLLETHSTSFFEMTVAMAFQYFKQENIDIAVLETGLGGRLDSTNIVTPFLSIITNIGRDHADILGNTLERIAIEKAGIIKQNVPVIIGEANNTLRTVFERIAKSREAPIFFAQDQIKINRESTFSGNYQLFTTDMPGLMQIECDLQGHYQEKNVCTVLKSTELLNQQGLLISKECIKEGFKKTVQNTGLMGRWQIINKKPLIICDIAHNEPGIHQIVKQLSELKAKQLHMVIGFVNDKEIDKMLSFMPKDAKYYFCKADIPRGLDAEKLMQQGLKAGLYGNYYPCVKGALEAAKKNTTEDDVIIVGGSAFVVAEVI
ncbi:MAG: bifunctional folylpolyglutamate synthase/dihydrofolate synthase [Bacteroidales bacterium]|nr:bifunctional folylpolyglutamate synthase/dihydrofolate synthase [Bacteroidales bacterium]